MNKADIDRFNEALDALKALSLKITAATVAGQSALRGLEITSDGLALDILSTTAATVASTITTMEYYLDDISDLVYELYGEN